MFFLKYCRYGKGKRIRVQKLVFPFAKFSIFGHSAFISYAPKISDAFS